MAAASEREMFDLNANVDGGEDEEREEDYEENAETNSATNHMSKKRRYHRHTPAQIQKLESVYKECPHPNKKERMEISEELGLEPLQVKFWFQNKRTQMKSKHERDEVRLLRAEIGRLKNENKIYKDALSSGCCSSCAFTAAGGGGDGSGDDHLLRMENARLKDEIDRISAIAAKYVGVEKVEPLE